MQKKRTLAITEWDFDVSEEVLPKSQLWPCVYYEYARECRPLRGRVKRWRDIRKEYDRAGDQANPVVRAVFYHPLAEYPPFPSKPWLEIPIDERSSLLKKHPLPLISIPNRAATSGLTVLGTALGRYYAPPESAIRTLDWACETGKQIQDELEYLAAAWKIAMTSQNPGESFYAKVKSRLETVWARFNDSLSLRFKAKIEKRKEELEKLARQEAASMLLQHLSQTEEEMRQILRGRVETIAMQIDWAASNRDLESSFSDWLKQNRVDCPRENRAGDRAAPKELLKAIGAKRILMYNRPLAIKNNSLLPTEVLRFVKQERERHNRKSEPLYKHLPAFNKAEKKAEKLISILFPEPQA